MLLDAGYQLLGGEALAQLRSLNRVKDEVQRAGQLGRLEIDGEMGLGRASA